MGKIYFIRHGESEWNVTDQICGQTDVPLTEKGHKQAEKTGKNIVESGISADLILCSPLLRAKQTAQHIAEMTGIPLQVEPRLVEQNFGFHLHSCHFASNFQNTHNPMLLPHY